MTGWAALGGQVRGQRGDLAGVVHHGAARRSHGLTEAA